METKTDVVLKFVHNVRPSFMGRDNEEMFIHQVTFSNGDKGEVLTPEENMTVFKEGTKVTYTIEPAKRGGGYTVRYVDPNKQKRTNNGGRSYQPRNEKAIMVQCAYKIAGDFHAQRGQSTIADVIRDGKKLAESIIEDSI